MNRRLFGAFGVLAVVALPVGGCKGDPLSNGDGTPSQVVTDFSYLQLPIGGTVAGGDTLVISATALLQFVPATVSVNFAGGGTGFITAKSATSLSVLVPFGANGAVTIGGISVTYAPGVVVSLDATTAVTQTGD